MFFNLATHIHGLNEVIALSVSLLFIVITYAKEKRDERKRA